MNVLRCFRIAEIVVFIQLLIGAIGVYIAWRSHKLAERNQRSVVSNPSYPTTSGSGYCSVSTGGSTPPPVPTLHARTFHTVHRILSSTNPTPAYPITAQLCTALFIVDGLGAEAETSSAQQAQAQASGTYGSSSGSSSSSPPTPQSIIANRGYVSEDQELGFLVSALNIYYLYAYNLYWTSTPIANNPFTNNQCLYLLQQQNNQQQYEKLSMDIEAYASLAVKAQKPTDVIYALVMTYFITRVRIIQIQNATLDLSASAVYNPSTDTITFQPQFITIVSPQLGPRTKALIGTGTCSPAQLASTMLQAGEHNPTFTNISTGKQNYTFICGSAS
jgi:hypothetical protein